MPAGFNWRMPIKIDKYTSDKYCDNPLCIFSLTLDNPAFPPTTTPNHHHRWFPFVYISLVKVNFPSWENPTFVELFHHSADTYRPWPSNITPWPYRPCFAIHQSVSRCLIQWASRLGCVSRYTLYGVTWFAIRISRDSPATSCRLRVLPTILKSADVLFAALRVRSFTSLTPIFG